MPDREKLLKAIEFCRDNASCDGCPYDEECAKRDAIEDDTLAFLREQEPVEPTKQHIEKPKVDLWYCGECGKWIGKTFAYCPWCGKAVKWDEA
jgi:hypothetical protein